MIYKMKIKLVILFCIISVVVAGAAWELLQCSRPNDKMGINVFESAKKDTIPFTAFAVRWRVILPRIFRH